MPITTHEAHELAKRHRVYLRGVQAAKAAVERERKRLRREAGRLRVRATAMMDKAADIMSQSDVYDTYGTPLQTIHDTVEEAAYWEARKAIAEEHGGEP